MHKEDKENIKKYKAEITKNIMCFIDKHKCTLYEQSLEKDNRIVYNCVGSRQYLATVLACYFFVQAFISMWKYLKA